MVKVLFAARSERWEDYEVPLKSALSEVGLEAEVVLEAAPETVDYVVYAPNSDLQDFRPYTGLKAVLNLWAGVEDVIGNETLTAPLCRMVDDGLTQGMVEWVTGHVLRHHLGMDRHILGQDGVWRKEIPPLAQDRTVGMFGLGALGSACAKALVALGFHVVGWSRSTKDIPGVQCLHGAAGLEAALSMSEIAVLLIPAASTSENLLDAQRLAKMPKGAVIINPGRGPLIDDAALLGALDRGQIAHATLDVFRQEPLPAEHPYWAHPQVTVTPHIASETRAESAARVVAENIRRGEAGEPFLHLVDRSDR